MPPHHRPEEDCPPSKKRRNPREMHAARQVFPTTSVSTKITLPTCLRLNALRRTGPPSQSGVIRPNCMPPRKFPQPLRLLRKVSSQFVSVSSPEKKPLLLHQKAEQSVRNACSHTSFPDHFSFHDNDLHDLPTHRRPKEFCCSVEKRSSPSKMNAAAQVVPDAPVS